LIGQLQNLEDYFTAFILMPLRIPKISGQSWKIISGGIFEYVRSMRRPPNNWDLSKWRVLILSLDNQKMLSPVSACRHTDFGTLGKRVGFANAVRHSRVRF
jgi:hypothetical protein